METSVVIAGGLGCLAVVVVLVIVLAVVGHRRERERKERLQYWAVRNHWQYQPHPRVEWWRRMPGRNRRGVSLALMGVLGGRPVAVAEYSYTTTSTTNNSDGSTSSSSTTHHYVLYVVRLREPWPAVAVHRRGAMSRFGRTLFGDRATALGYEPFDSAYRISAERPETVRQVFGRDLVAEHVAGRLPEWSLHGDELMSTEAGRIAEPERIPGRFGALVRIADLIETPRS
jgi:hypothetical protein